MRIRRSSTDRINNASIAVSRRRPKSGSTSAGPKCRTRVKASVAPNGFPVTWSSAYMTSKRSGTGRSRAPECRPDKHHLGEGRQRDANSIRR